ncbi:MAG TPA: ATP-binding protein [Lachnospiraceae bacterium]|nr:ATP-binding protein [Lachnospiraceae bacterium]
MRFLCRENELRKMNRRYEAGKFECIIIYGRRRVGKTALINEFCKNKKTVFFSALRATAQENLKALSKAIYECDHPETENYPVYQDFEAALDEIGRMGRDERLIFVIDEYPYLAKAYEAISSRIQHLIDHRWQESRLYLILSGSSVSFMENQVLGYQSPLYGRRTAQFKIEKLTYKETATFYPNLTNEQNACVYGMTGGIPHYINKLDIRDSLDEAVIDNIFDRSGYLFEEPENLLKQELRDPGVYNSIIRAIAQGASKLNEIATKTGLPSGVCTTYINTLMELEILKKETPITEKPGKKTIYLIDDNFFRFWYRFVPENYSLIVSGRFPSVYERAVKSKMHDYMGPIFEKMCREYLLRYAPDLPFELSDVGQWWGTDPKTRKQVQIDIVGVPVRENEQRITEYLIGSCKFRNEKIGMDELTLLEDYAQVFGKGLRYRFVIFSLGGFTDELLEAAKTEGVQLITLDDLYSL